MGDGQDLREDADESADLADVLASLDESEVEPTPVASEAEMIRTDPVEGEIEAAPAQWESDVSTDAGTAEADEVSDPGDVELPDAEIVAPQVEQAAEGDAPEPAAEDSTAEPVSAESDDDAAPAAVGGQEQAAQDAKDIALPADRAGIPVWPFMVYLGLWVVFAGLFVWQSLQVPAGTPLYELNLYGISILVGLVLTALGPLLAIGVWLACWLSRPGARAGLFSRALIIGAVSTLAGVAIWLVALGAVDVLRLGRLL